MNILVSGLFSAAESYGKSTAVFEIILMLLVAFLLGCLFHRFLSRSSNETDWEAKYKDAESRYGLLEKRFSQLQSENRKLTDDLDACIQKLKETGAPGYGLAQTSAKVPQRKDDLKKIEGIGPKIQQLLNERGIYTFEDLAGARVEDLEAILREAGPRFRVHTPESWPLQARMAADGRWDELKAWQEEHKYGRL